MTTTRHIALEVALHWRSVAAEHTDRRFFDRLSLWRDFFPGDLGARLRDCPVGAAVTVDLPPGELVPDHDRALVQRLARSRFRTSPRPGLNLLPRVGRFYPATFFDTSLFFSGDYRPSRIVALDDEAMTVDFNHPLAGCAAHVEATVVADLGEGAERGGRCNDIAQEITARGPGMQAEAATGPTDFVSGEPFARLDPRDDALFYAAPRLVHHLDATCRARITGIYAGFLRPGMRVLDLMSSWVSHLPDDIPVEATGVGLNAEELAANPRLRERVVQDLNREPRLPFDDAGFDAAFCTASVEYLIRPLEVFAELARVLKPDAPFVVSFSERWFPSKAIGLWSELHPFERMGLVLQLFRRSGVFKDLRTESLRGLPRPEDDAYADRMHESDPVYVVSGRRA